MKLPNSYTLILLPIFTIVSFICGLWVGQKPSRLFPDGQIYDSPQDKGMVAGTESATIRESSQRVSFSKDTLWSLINNYRVSQGLIPWTKDRELCKLVHERLTQLQKNGALDNHQGFHKLTPIYLGQIGFRKLVENIAGGYVSPKDIVNGWTVSLPHHALLLSTEMNTACAESAGGFGVLVGGKR